MPVSYIYIYARENTLRISLSVEIKYAKSNRRNTHSVSQGETSFLYEKCMYIRICVPTKDMELFCMYRMENRKHIIWILDIFG